MLDFIGIIVLVAAIIVSINALTGAMPISPSQRLALSVGAGLWTGLAAALAGANLFLGSNPVGPPTIGTMIVLPLVAAAVAASFSPSARAALLGMPMPFLIGSCWRLAGRPPLPRGRRPACRTVPDLGGLGRCDNRCAGLAGRSAPRGQGRALVWTWNAFGMLDLAAARAFGIISANGSPLQIIHAGQGLGGGAIMLPWSLIPTVVLMFLIVHGRYFRATGP